MRKLENVMSIYLDNEEYFIDKFEYHDFSIDPTNVIQFIFGIVGKVTCFMRRW